MWSGFKLMRCRIMMVSLDFKLDWIQNQLRDVPAARTIRLLFVMITRRRKNLPHNRRHLS